jgi:hypothetical protein
MEMKKMLDKKSKENDNSAEKKDAKLSALKGLRQMASEMMGEDLKSGNLKKVTVAAKDSQGLEKGLEKAKELVPQMDQMKEESAEEENSEEESEDADQEIEDAAAQCESPEEIDALIAKLQDKKREMMK